MSEFNKEWGYTRKYGEKRSLTADEHQNLLHIREKVVKEAIVPIEINLEKFSKVLQGIEDKKVSSVVITFDEEDEAGYVRFLEWIFDEFGGPRGINFSPIALPMSLSIRPELLRRVISEFNLRPPLIHDFERSAQKIVSPYSFDAANLEGRHVPGLGHFRKRDRSR